MEDKKFNPINWARELDTKYLSVKYSFTCPSCNASMKVTPSKIFCFNCHTIPNREDDNG